MSNNNGMYVVECFNGSTNKTFKRYFGEEKKANDYIVYYKSLYKKNHAKITGITRSIGAYPPDDPRYSA